MVEKHSDRFAYQQGGHFFYPKAGETLNQNWIVENLNNAFSTWNGKLTELWGLVTTSPQTFKGGAVWGVMQSLHSAMIGIGYALIVLFFAISLFKNTANFHELKRPEAAVHYLIRFVAAKALVGYGMDIMLSIFSICNGVVSDMAAGMGGISQAMVTLPGEVQSAIENVGFLASIPLWLVTILGSLFFSAVVRDDPHRVRAVLSPVYVHGAGSLAAGELCRGKHTVGRHFLYQELCRRLLRGCCHRAGLCHLCRLCQHTHGFGRRGYHDGVELSDRNYLQYACAGRADQRL